MVKLIEEFRRGWQGTSQPSPLFSIGFAASCIVLSTAARWCLSLIRPDVFFTPYIPAVFFAAAFGGYRVGIATALLGGVLGATVNFSDAQADFARMALMVIYLIVCGLTIWGIEHFRSIALHQREISKRLIEEEEYRKLIVDELQHRLKNKSSTIHAVLHQVLYNQPFFGAHITNRRTVMTRARVAFAATLVAGSLFGAELIAQTVQAPQLEPILAGRKFTLPSQMPTWNPSA
jgi:hypothetical protein